MMEQDLDGIGLSADALAALREFALERGITVEDDDESFDIRKEVQTALEEEKGPNEDKFTYSFGDDISIQLNGLRRDIGQTLNSTGLTLWRAGDFLSDFMFKHPHLFAGKRALEDGDDESMVLLEENCKLNGLDTDVCCQKLLWGEDLTPETQGTYDVLIGADIIYEKDYVGPLFATASHFLARSSDANIFYLAYTKRNVSIDYVLANDCPSCDFRLAKIPPQTHPIGSQRDVYVFSPDYPRYGRRVITKVVVRLMFNRCVACAVGTTRGPAYDPALVDRRFFNWTDTTPIAQIPQVQSTYGYIEGVYPIMNDHRVAMGESTCAAKFVSKPVSGGGRARLDIVELGRLALERTTCARDAIALMGGMAETYGYYGSFWETPSAFENAGEALTITDPTEAWMLHMLPDDTGASAIWVAQRVHDNHVAAVANRFVIREINFTDTDHFMASANVLDIAKRHGFWDGVAPFDFTDAYAGPPDMTLSSSLRVGRVLSLANKNVNVDTFADTTPFFSAKADTLLTVQDVMRFQRDHYEGTKFDLTKGPASGPYGDPNRYEIADADVGTGHFERAIGIYEATYTFVSVLDATNRYNDHIWYEP
ncbi:hypothetical protein DYB31_005334 [Aphanomyces astaci]|uniref:Uncharacterized protein n=1 Tax=Aphanomyces astaci TaxID=112090 RepID=A0A397ELN6_APHAT|nr:hypothetical protein DYB31_005334 [Aphanomyces astaci]